MKLVVRAAALATTVAASLAVSFTAAGGAVAAERTPVLVELFTAEGCSSCPPADTLLSMLISKQPIEGIEIIGLSEHVDYWDDLGWHDPFSSRRFSERQALFAQSFGDPRAVFTPQAVVQGRGAVNGADYAGIRRLAVEAAAGPLVPVTLEATRGGGKARVTVRAGVRPEALRKSKLRVQVAIVEDELATQVTSGENANKRLTHDGVVRSLDSAGELAGGDAPGELVKELPLGSGWAAGKLRAIVFLQDPRSLRVVGVATAPLGAAAAAAAQAPAEAR